MDNTDIKDVVRARYGEIALGTGADLCAPAGGGCCAPVNSIAADRKSREMGYSPEELAAVPEGANLGLGCGNPQAIASLRVGEVVVDLGSGAGFDCFLAARQVGPEGRVIGVDMTHEMLRKARDNAARIGAGNVEFRLGEIEHLPIADNTADVILSNCVINLAGDKAQVFRDAFRVLAPGGRLAIADVVSTAVLPREIAADQGMLCGCIAGAASVGDLERWLEQASFSDIRITVRPESRTMIESWAPGRGIEDFVASAIIEARKPGVAREAAAQAVRQQAPEQRTGRCCS